jgi:type I restriction enzyme S subunit
MENEKLKMENYKQTELGHIPDDWEVNRFTDIAELIHGFQFREEHFAENGRFGVIKIGNLTYQGNISLDNLSKSDCEGINNYERLFLRRGDILMALTGGTLGKMSIFNLEENRYLQNYRVGKFEPNEKSIKNYIYYLLSSTYVQKRIEDNVNEAAQPNFGKQDFDKIKIPLPPLPEQKKIADCLSTWDCAIEKQSQLINALTQRKKALMQQLLTGKKRLPGFSDEWKEVKLGEIAKTFSGGTPKSTIKEYYIGNIPFIKSGEINSTQTEQFINEEGIKNSSAKKVNKGDLLYALYGATSGTVGISNIDGAINQAVLCIRTKENKFYLFYLLDYLKQNIINSFLQGGQGNLSSKIINELNINIPTISEQTAIAAILATADRELQLQKEKLAQLQIQKKGLMQVLLTGKKRLIN